MWPPVLVLAAPLRTTTPQLSGPTYDLASGRILITTVNLFVTACQDPDAKIHYINVNAPRRAEHISQEIRSNRRTWAEETDARDAWMRRNLHRAMVLVGGMDEADAAKILDQEGL